MNFNDTFKGIFGSLDGDMCRLTMNGKLLLKLPVVINHIMSKLVD